MRFLHFHRHAPTFSASASDGQEISGPAQPVLPRGLSVPCIGIAVRGHKVYVAVSFTSPNDVYNKRLGRTITKNRIESAVRDGSCHYAAEYDYYDAGVDREAAAWKLARKIAAEALTTKLTGRGPYWASLNRNDRFWYVFRELFGRALHAQTSQVQSV